MGQHRKDDQQQGSGLPGQQFTPGEPEPDSVTPPGSGSHRQDEDSDPDEK